MGWRVPEPRWVRIFSSWKNGHWFRSNVTAPSGGGSPPLAGHGDDPGPVWAPTPTRARWAYRAFVAEGLRGDHRPEFGGGGLLRSAGDWAAVRALRRRGDPTVADPRILGGGDFVERLLAEVEPRTRATLRVGHPKPGFAVIA